MAATASPTGDAEGDANFGVVDSLVQLSFAVHGLLNQTAATYDLSLTQVRMLGILRDRRLGTVDLARALELEKSSVSGLVSRAELRGLLRRTISSVDGRAVVIVLTRDGQRLARTFHADVAAGIAALTADLSDTDRRRLSGLASRLVHRHAELAGLTSPER